MALLKIIKLSTKTWKHNSDVDGDFILTKFYAKQEDNEFLLVETYGAKRRKYLISEIEVYDIGGTAETFLNFTDLFLRLEALKYPAFYVDGESTGGGTWGTITGNLSDQTDLETALNLKQNTLDAVNFGEFMDLELATKLTPSPNDTILGRDFLTNESIEFNYPIVEGYFNGTNFYLEAGFINLITATTGRTYVNLSTNLQYRWSGTAYVQIGGGEQNIEVITLQNRWTLTNFNIYYRSRFDYAGFNDAVMNYSAGASSYATLTQIQRSQSSFFYCAIGNKKLHKIIVDVGSIGATITSYTLMIVACKRVSTNSNNTSTINGINLGEYNMTKADGNLNDFHIIIPNDVTIPDGYIVTCYLKRYDGATNEINCSIMFQFKNA